MNKPKNNRLAIFSLGLARIPKVFLPTFYTEKVGLLLTFLQKSKGEKKADLIEAATRLGEEVMKNHFGLSHDSYRHVFKKSLAEGAISPPFDLHNLII